MQQNFILTSNVPKFSCRIKPALMLDGNKTYTLQPKTFSSFWNVQNITPSNNTFTYSDGTDSFNVYIPPGRYEFTQIFASILSQLDQVQPEFTFQFSATTMTITITPNLPGYSIPAITPLLTMMGMTQDQFPATTAITSVNTPKIEPFNHTYVCCSVISPNTWILDESSRNGLQLPVIFSINHNDVDSTGMINLSTYGNKLEYPLKSVSSVDEIQIYLMQPDGQILKNSQDLEIQLHIVIEAK